MSKRLKSHLMSDDFVSYLKNDATKTQNLRNARLFTVRILVKLHSDTGFELSNHFWIFQVPTL
jgi:hypothetical protein